MLRVILFCRTKYVKKKDNIPHAFGAYIFIIQNEHVDTDFTEQKQAHQAKKYHITEHLKCQYLVSDYHEKKYTLHTRMW